MFTVHREGIFVSVLRDKEVICKGRCVGVAPNQEILRDIRFTKDEYRKNNKTRQAAMRALQREGYK